MRREIAFIDHLLGLVVPLTSLDGGQDWMAMYSAWGPILPQQVFIRFPLPTLGQWYQYCRSKKAAWIFVTALFSRGMWEPLEMAANGICPWYLGPCRENEMKGLQEAGDRREAFTQELPLINAISPAWTQFEIYSAYLLYMYIQNRFKTISMISTSILIAVLI